MDHVIDKSLENYKNIAKKTQVVYTCITRNYDELNNHSFIHPDWDYVCFTDNLNIKNSNNSSWHIKSLAFSDLDDVRNQRWHKMHPHLLFKEYERSIWVDGNIDLLNKEVFDDVNKIINESRKMSISQHPFRDCIFDEFNACMTIGKDDKEVMETQNKLIRKDGFPENYGLFETGIIFREHHDQEIIKIMDDWWWWIEHYSRRDQLSLTYVLWKNGMEIQPLSKKNYRDSNNINIKYGDKHITKEELIVKLQNEVINLKEEIRLMKSSKFWKIRNMYLNIKKIFLE